MARIGDDAKPGADMACRPGEAIETTECCGRNEAERRETEIFVGEPGTRRRNAEKTTLRTGEQQNISGKPES